MSILDLKNSTIRIDISEGYVEICAVIPRRERMIFTRKIQGTILMSGMNVKSEEKINQEVNRLEEEIEENKMTMDEKKQLLYASEESENTIYGLVKSCLKKVKKKNETLQDKEELNDFIEYCISDTDFSKIYDKCLDLVKTQSKGEEEDYSKKKESQTIIDISETKGHSQVNGKKKKKKRHMRRSSNLC